MLTKLCSEEIPVATRRWPAWRHRLAPAIVFVLSGRPAGCAAVRAASPAALPSAARGAVHSLEDAARRAVDRRSARALEQASRTTGHVPQCRTLKEVPLPKKSLKPSGRAVASGKENAQAVTVGEEPGRASARRRAAPRRFTGYVMDGADSGA